MELLSVIILVCTAPNIVYSDNSWTSVPSFFYPFGSINGDSIAAVNDDGYTGPISISKRFQYFQTEANSLYVNTNGGISFGNGIGTYVPRLFPLGSTYKFIALFWTDIDTNRNNGRIYYRETTNQNLLDRLTSDVLQRYGFNLFKANWAFIATWHNVTYFGGNSLSNTNTFQMALISDDHYSFTIFNYGEVTWPYGTSSSSHKVEAGYNAGDGEKYFIIPGSMTNDILHIENTTNVDLPGRWVFRIDNVGCRTNERCQPHEVEKSGTCEAIAPALDTCPTLIGPDVVNRMYIYFYCSFSHSYNISSDAMFKVTFLFDGKTANNVPVFVVNASINSVSLHEKYLHGNLGKLISCSLKTYFSNTSNQLSQAVNSSGYYAGIVPSSNSMNVYEESDTPAKIYLKSTLPITCLIKRNNVHFLCYRKFNIDSSNELVVYQKGRQEKGEEKFTCQYLIDESDWKSSEKNAYDTNYQLEVLTTRSLTVEPPNVDYINFDAVPYAPKYDEDGNAYTPIWNDYKPPTITVYRYDTPNMVGASCVASGDPRMTTFDNVYYNAYANGQFVYVKSTSTRGFEVHVRHHSCNRAGGTIVACVCAIAVREGNDTLILDMCDNKPLERLRKTVSANGKLAEGASITCNYAGSSYTIRTAAGAYVNVYTYSWGMNVYLYALGQDFGKTEGLCGTYDNDRSNDLKVKNTGEVVLPSDTTALNTFMQSWRILPGESLFEKDPDPLLPSIATVNDFCDCSQLALDEQIPCGNIVDTYTYNFVTFPQINVQIRLIVSISSKKRRKRALAQSPSNNIDNIVYNYDPTSFNYAPDSSNVAQFSWPTSTNITEEQAKAHCNSTIQQSSAYSQCSNYLSNIGDVIDKCVEDIKVSGSLDWADDKLDEIQTDCITNVLQSNVTGSNSTQNGTQPILQIANEIVANICPNQCNHKGQCVNSVCQCQTGYEGADCSVSRESLSDVYLIANDAICDISEIPCTTISLRATNLISTPNLTCKIQDVGGSSIFYTSASFQGSQEVLCSLPSLGDTPSITRYNISVTRHDEYGNSQQLVLYDGNCTSCTQPNQCTQKDATCSISNICYGDSEGHPNNTCLVCNSTNSRTSWTISQENLPPVLNVSRYFEKIHSEEITAELEAYDPEGKTVTFRLADFSDAIYVSLTSNGTLTWKSSSNQNLTLGVLIIDDCDKIQRVFLILSIIKCPCPENSKCIPKASMQGHYDCECIEGYTGQLCETNIDDCISVNCNNGTCVDDVNTYTCNCSLGYSGSACNINIQECHSSPCIYGQCMDQVNGYNCECESGYTGVHCETDINECDSNPCFNGTCKDTVSRYMCECIPGFTGTNCETEINECDSNPCFNGTCKDMVSRYICECIPGFTGTNCETEVDECDSNPCFNGTCKDMVSRYICECIPGFTGTNCETEVDECHSNPCFNGTCKDKVSRYMCECIPGFTGTNCETEINECDSNPCFNGTCKDTVSRYICECIPGFTGTNCETEVDECDSNPCFNGTCKDMVSRYICECIPGFTGTNCETEINECDSNPCFNGTCKDTVSRYICECIPGFTGTNCETEVNECDSNPCFNGTCKDMVSRYMCECIPGFTGTNCETEVNECVSNPCTHGTCVDGINRFQCICSLGYSGEKCEDEIDECESNPCFNGTCQNEINQYRCSCTQGFTGTNCESNINECASSPCFNGNCIDNVNTYTCECMNGYTGVLCETNINECISCPCLQNGTCIDDINGYTCSCLNGYTGIHCETNIDECASNPCINGQCKDIIDGYNCECNNGYSSKNCEINVDECSSNPCLNGTCMDAIAHYKCNCKVGYTGIHCETDVDECGSSPCVNGSCIDGINKFECQCEKGYVGDYCQIEYKECQSNPCHNGLCNDLIGIFSCICNTGYTGTLCETEINECDSNPCFNGTCKDMVSRYICECIPGFTGTNCETEVDECDSNPCFNGTCKDMVSRYMCECIPGFTGTNCETEVNECVSNPCTHGTCVDGINRFQCICSLGYSGEKCEDEIDECGSNPCFNGTCQNEINQYRCSCTQGFTGTNCESNINECASSPCFNGNCIDNVNTYTCECMNGYTGVHCETNINECISSPCLQNGTCIDDINGYTCSCLNGYTGIHCETNIDECASNPCINGQCKDIIDGYKCECNNGYSGKNCEINVDECSSNPCLNGTCMDAIAHYKCNCKVGYTGINCETDVDECGSSPCVNGSCIDGINKFECQCEKGYVGDYCQIEYKECQSNPCHNGICNDLIDIFSCICNTGYTGTLCETEINECDSNPCFNGTCKDMVSRYICECIPGFTGTNCETEVDECDSNPCFNGTCKDMVSRYMCECIPGFTGTNCETEVNECVSNPCTHGTCVDGINRFQCICSLGYSGEKCEDEIDECESNPCFNGTCQNEINQYRCSCTQGFTGTNCESNFNECASSPCFNGNCIDNVNTYTCECMNGYTGVLCETNINECISRPCLENGTCIDDINGYKCECNNGYSGKNCEKLIDYCNETSCNNNGTCVPQVNGYFCKCHQFYTGINCDSDVRYNMWTAWSVYSNCSKVCNYGLQTRSRQCLLPSTCSGSNQETVICNQFYCKETSSEKLEGVEAILPESSFMKLLLLEDQVFKLIAEGINEYCSLNIVTCCQVVISTSVNRISQGLLNLFTGNNVRTASGYPRKTTSGTYISKFVADILASELRAACTKTIQRDVSKVYIPGAVVQQAIIRQQPKIAQTLGINLTVLNSVFTTTTTTIDVTSQLDSSETIYITVGIALFIIVTAVIIIVSVMRCQNSKGKRKNINGGLNHIGRGGKYNSGFEPERRGSRIYFPEYTINKPEGTVVHIERHSVQNDSTDHNSNVGIFEDESYHGRVRHSSKFRDVYTMGRKENN